METVFHKILSGELPNYTVYEDEHVLAFLDIYANAKGHTLVVPKIFAETLLDFPDNALAGYISGVKRTMEKIDQVLSPSGFSVGWNVRETSGVPYIHCHVIPRYPEDGGGNMQTIVNKPDGELEEIAKLFE